MSKDTEFQNPECLPAERLTLTVSSAGLITTVKALDAYWVQQREWSLYWRVPSGSGLVLGAMDAWCTNAQALLLDLKFLLSLRHHRFWSHMVHEPRCTDTLVSFLQEAEPPYCEPPPPPACDLYRHLRARVAALLCRLVTERESEKEWMTREYLGRVIYEQYILSVPALFEVCLVYGADNPRQVARLLASVFTLQPRYATDLETAVAFMQEVFKYTTVQVNNKCVETLEPPSLPETFKGFGEIKRPTKGNNGPEKLTFNILRDLITHLLDSALTIRIFVEVYPPAVEVLRKRGFVLSVVQLYENALPSVYEQLEQLCEAGDARAQALRQLEMARGELVDIVREVLAASTDAVLCGDGDVERHAADYFTTMMDVLSERLLARDYQAAYPVNEDLDMLRQAYPAMDSVKTDFILQAVYSNMEEPSAPPLAASAAGRLAPSPPPAPSEPAPDIPNDLKEESLISEVKDILPHLGEGFILKCLQHYGFNSERVINGVLEGTLDASLRSLDQSLPLIPVDPLDARFLETGVARLNVFDGDEFDVMTRDDVDVTRVHVGKRRGKFSDLGKMLDDKSAVKQRMDIYSKYNLVAEEEDMYSDEYDDTYDAGGALGVRDDGADDSRRPLVKPRVLRQMDNDDAKSSSEEEETVEATAGGAGAAGAGGAAGSGARARSGAGGKPMDFCVNPELVRARREAAWRANQKPGRPPPKGGDVVGKARGQGQEKEVLVNRDRKNQNKSSRGNHSRRQGAQWKRTQGMMPS